MSKPASAPFLRRVRIRNYKSIARCDVELRPLTVLVGRNGSGKSHVLDALEFVHDALLFSPDIAVRLRGGPNDLNGVTVVAPIDRASREAIKEHLCSAGELLRMDHLQPIDDDFQRQMDVLEAVESSE